MVSFLTLRDSLDSLSQEELHSLTSEKTTESWAWLLTFLTRTESSSTDQTLGLQEKCTHSRDCPSLTTRSPSSREPNQALWRRHGRPPRLRKLGTRAIGHKELPDCQRERTWMISNDSQSWSTEREEHSLSSTSPRKTNLNYGDFSMLTLRLLFLVGLLIL